MRPKESDEMANSVDPDQTAPSDLGLPYPSPYVDFYGMKTLTIIHFGVTEKLIKT